MCLFFFSCRWLCYCQVPVFCDSLQKYDPTAVFGRVLLRSVFSVMRRQLMEKFRAERDKMPVDKRAIVLTHFPRFVWSFFFFFLVNPSFVICGQVILCFECHKMAIILFHLYPHCNIRFPHFSCLDAFSCLMCLKYYFDVVKFKALSVLHCAFNWYVLIFWLFWFLWVTSALSVQYPYYHWVGIRHCVIFRMKK